MSSRRSPPALRQRQPPLAAAPLASERVALVGGQRGEVERGLGIGRQHDERLTGGQAGEHAAGADQRYRAVQPADVERVVRRPYDGPMIAVILESGEPERLYTGLSLLVSAVAEGRPARALVSFGALGPLLDERLPAGPTEAFDRTLMELRDTAFALEDCRLWACAAAVEITGADRARVDARLDGVLSTPRFLAHVAGADLVVV
jgi:peroxiredoxin family protein